MKAYYSYVMGVDNSIYDLEKQGFLIENDGNNFMITFNADNASKWENFICKHLELGYWNEYLTENGVIFLFHLEDGIKKYEVYNYENAEVLALCEKLCECKFESIRSMLSGNHFYREKIKQKKMYLDMTEAGCTGVWMKDTEIIPAGTTVYSMSVKHKNEEYERFAKEYDIQFVFEDKVPVIDFYTIPRVDIFAMDSKGGYIGTVGKMTDLESDAPICYIDKDKKCYLIIENGAEFLKIASKWQENLIAYDGIDFYASKEAAMQENTFFKPEEMKGEQNE